MMRRFGPLAIVVLLGLVFAGPALAADEPLEKRLRDRDRDVRAKAVRAIRDAPSLRGLQLLYPLLADEDDYVRDLAWAAFTTVKDPEWIRWIAGATRTERRAGVRFQVADFLGRQRQPSALPALRQLVGDRDPAVRAAAATALGWFRESAEAAKIAKTALRDGRPEVRAAGVSALWRIDARASVSDFMTALRDDDPGVRCVALGALAAGQRDIAIEAGAYALLEDGWRVRAQAIENAVGLRDRGVVEGLVEGLGRVRRARLRADLFAALRELTGLELPDAEADWKEWWERNGAEWRKGGRIPKRERPAHASAAARYYGIPVDSDRVVFLLDGSSSMRGFVSSEDRRVKMDAAREELLRVLDELGDRVRFNVIVFHDEPDAFRREIGPADRASRRKVESFVRRATGSGLTNVYDALVLALADEEADTIFLLSDGAPSTGSLVFRSRILDHVGRVNARRKFAIHTIAFGGKAANRTFLADLARRNGGVSVVADGR